MGNQSSTSPKPSGSARKKSADGVLPEQIDSTETEDRTSSARRVRRAQMQMSQQEHQDLVNAQDAARMEAAERRANTVRKRTATKEREALTKAQIEDRFAQQGFANIGSARVVEQLPMRLAEARNGRTARPSDAAKARELRSPFQHFNACSRRIARYIVKNIINPNLAKIADPHGGIDVCDGYRRKAARPATHHDFLAFLLIQAREGLRGSSWDQEGHKASDIEGKLVDLLRDEVRRKVLKKAFFLETESELSGLCSVARKAVERDLLTHLGNVFCIDERLFGNKSWNAFLERLVRAIARKPEGVGLMEYLVAVRLQHTKLPVVTQWLPLTPSQLWTAAESLESAVASSPDDSWWVADGGFPSTRGIAITQQRRARLLISVTGQQGEFQELYNAAKQGLEVGEARNYWNPERKLLLSVRSQEQKNGKASYLGTISSGHQPFNSRRDELDELEKDAEMRRTIAYNAAKAMHQDMTLPGIQEFFREIAVRGGATDASLVEDCFTADTNEPKWKFLRRMTGVDVRWGKEGDRTKESLQELAVWQLKILYKETPGCSSGSDKTKDALIRGICGETSRTRQKHPELQDRDNNDDDDDEFRATRQTFQELMSKNVRAEGQTAYNRLYDAIDREDYFFLRRLYVKRAWNSGTPSIQAFTCLRDPKYFQSFALTCCYDTMFAGSYATYVELQAARRLARSGRTTLSEAERAEVWSIDKYFREVILEFWKVRMESAKRRVATESRLDREELRLKRTREELHEINPRPNKRAAPDSNSDSDS